MSSTPTDVDPLMVLCSGKGSCGAAPGAPCVSGGKQVPPHLARVRDAPYRELMSQREVQVQPAPPGA